MDALPLLNFPPDVVEMIVDKFTILQLFQLSQSSKKAMNVVKSSSTRHSFKIDIEIDSSLKLTLRKALATEHLDRSLLWEFYGYRNPRRHDLEDLSNYVINNKQVQFSKDPNSNRLVCPSRTTLEDVLKFTEHLIDVFNAKVTTAFVTLDIGVLDTIRSFPFFRTLLEVRFDTSRASRSLSMEMVLPDMSNEDMYRILTDLECPDSLSLKCSPGPDFQFDKTINAGMLTAFRGDWLKGHNLLNLNCERVRIEYGLLRNEDYNAFLRNWKASDDIKLEYLHVSPENTVDTRMNMEEILEGLSAFEGYPKRPSATRFPNNDVPYEEGFDLRRKSDGMLATVLMLPDNVSIYSFLFVVWHDLNPNVIW